MVVGLCGRFIEDYKIYDEKNWDYVWFKYTYAWRTLWI